jgi:hypothetical protein
MTAAMRKRLILLGLLAAAGVLAPAARSARAQTPLQHSIYRQYIDPVHRYHEGDITHSGREMARFMKSLGAQVQDPPGHGSNSPFGKLC